MNVFFGTKNSDTKTVNIAIQTIWFVVLLPMVITRPSFIKFFGMFDLL